MNKLYFTSLLLLFLSVPLDSVYAGAWVQEKGESLHILTYYFYTTDDVFEDYGDLDSISNDGRFTKHQINYYTEVGVLERLTLIGNFFFDFLKSEDDFGTDRNAGFSDQEVGARFNIATSPVVFSVQGLFVFPTYDLDDEPILGNQDIGLEGKLLFGKGFAISGIPSYANVEGGVRFRIGEPSDQVRYQLLLGIKPGGWEIMLAVDGIEGLRNEEEFQVSENVTVNTDFSLVKTTGSVVIPVYRRRVFLELGGFWHVLGRNTGGGGGVKSGLWFRF
jgi:hypothetical protein